MRVASFLPVAMGMSVSLLALACADGDPLGTGGAGGDGGSAASTNPTTSSTSTSGPSTTTTGSTTSSNGGGGEGGAGVGGMGGGGGSDPCAMGCPTDLWDVDNNPLTGECGCEYACTQVSTDTDPIDENFTDDNCDGGDGLVEQCVYVSASQGVDSNPGTRDMPMQTIANALLQAQQNGVPAVCLSGELYQEAVTVIPGISIYGGFDQNDPDFKFRRKAGIITSVVASGAVFTVDNLTADTHIEGLTIVANASGTPGASTYGVRMATGSAQATLFVRYNVMQIAGGVAGANGSNGTPHAQAVAPNGNNGTNGTSGGSGGGQGGPQPACVEFGGKGGNGGHDSGDGQDGSPGSGGALGGSGAGSAGCFGGGNAGGEGNPGTPNGGQGPNGTGGAALGVVMGGGYAPSNGSTGQVGFNGRGGGGGGGGGGGEANCCCNADRGGGGGSGGCGGLGGNPGAGGFGGGGSFGVFVAGGKVVVTDNEITTGQGGAGGTGGNGANGQTGGAGGSGGSGPDDSGPGGIGGPGSNGGAGGPGGGGGGGPSACLGRSSAAMFTFSSNSCTTGLPGAGGAGGTNSMGGIGGSGSNGTASPNLQINRGRSPQLYGRLRSATMPSFRRAACVIFALLCGCLEVQGPAKKDRYPIRDVVTPTGESLDVACTPSGLEMCFDATDNNCNGVIDEGCGVHTGILQFAVAWDAPEADIDLVVTDASGDVVQPGEPTSAGLVKDYDCPGDRPQCASQPIENVYLMGGEPERGRYKVVVKLDKLGGAQAPIQVRLGARVGQRTYSMRFSLSPGGDSAERAFEFTL